MSVRILLGDVRDRLAELSSDSVDCVVTSPPYWGLRDYGVDGQLGLERTLGEHVSIMADVFDDVLRVLKPEGTLWLNYGDSYATSVNGRSAADTKAAGNDDRTFRDKPFSTVGPIYDPNGCGGFRGSNKGCAPTAPGRIQADGAILKPKDLCGIPWRVAFALQERGWWLRQDIIWSKPNPMPESIRDRCTKAHEYLFLLAKSERYYFDQESIAEPVAASTIVRLGQPTLDQQTGSGRVPGKTNGNMKAKPPRFGGSKYGDIGDGGADDETRTKSGNAYTETNGGNRNRRSVWTVPTQPFSEAHFATFPPDLIEPCILAGCPKGGTVLDPFFGAGTTGLVADRLGRNAIGIELNLEYAEMAMRRIQADSSLFADVSIEHTGPKRRDAA